jgi:electron transfer flavoprotein alpha subunit
MSVLIIGEPTTGGVKLPVFTTVGAAAKLNGDLHVLVIGADWPIMASSVTCSRLFPR